MRFAILGTGQVGSTVGGKLAALGHDVMFGSRHPDDDKVRDLVAKIGSKAGTYAAAADHAEIVVNALPGEATIAALEQCAIDGKVLIDIGNYNTAVDQPIEVPLGEAIQRAYPGVHVVKTLNSVSAHLMVDPADLGAVHSVFIAGDRAAAKETVTGLLQSFGWTSIVDLGDLTACRAMEQLIPLWMRLETAFGGPGFNLAVISKA